MEAVRLLAPHRRVDVTDTGGTPVTLVGALVCTGAPHSEASRPEVLETVDGRAHAAVVIAGAGPVGNEGAAGPKAVMAARSIVRCGRTEMIG